MLHGLINNVTKCPSPKINKIIEEKKKEKRERAYKWRTFFKFLIGGILMV
jgi:hypothetical protein